MADEKKKQKRIEIISERGTFKFPRLNEADYGTEKFPKPDGSFSTKLVMSRADAEAFVNAPQKSLEGKSLADLHAAAVAEGEEAFSKLKKPQRDKLKSVTITPLYAVEYDKDNDEVETGNVVFSVAMKHNVDEWKSGKKTGKKLKRYPVIFDGKGKRMGKLNQFGAPITSTLPNIWGGTVGKVSFTPSAYFVEGQGMAGLSLQLNAVQIISLVSNGARSADSYGFGAEEGYEYEEPTATAAEEGDEFSKPAGDAAPSDNDGSADF